MDHQPMPVAGYTPQSQEAIDAANALKQAEERIWRMLDSMVADGERSERARCVAIARTEIQTGFMWAVRGIFQPQRISLPEDDVEALPPPIERE